MTGTQRKRMNQTKQADALFSKLIRSRGRCEAATYRIACSSTLQCAHIISRRYRSIRWDLSNALALCGAHHVWFTHHPLEWEEFCRGLLGVPWDGLRHRALYGQPEPAADALARLRSLPLREEPK